MNDYSFNLVYIEILLDRWGEDLARISHKDENLEKILESILELGFESGYEKLVISKIAKKAGVSPGTLYLYFKDKNEILRWVFANIGQKIEDILTTRFDAYDTVENRTRFLFTQMLSFYLTNKFSFFFINHFISINFGTKRSIFSPRIEKLFFDLYQEGEKNKYIKPLNFFMILSLINGPILAVVRHHYLGNLKINKAMRQQMEDAMWDAIKLQ